MADNAKEHHKDGIAVQVVKFAHLSDKGRMNLHSIKESCRTCMVESERSIVEMNTCCTLGIRKMTDTVLQEAALCILCMVYSQRS